ncbi:MAG: amidohydrolase family protein [Gemmatimonadales bacterium]
MRIDVNAFVGHYPFRRLEGGAPEQLLLAMDRVASDEAWIGNLAAVFWRDPTEGNETLYRIAAAHQRLKPVPAVHPGLEGWRDALAEAADRGAPAVRVDPLFYGVSPLGAHMAALASEAGRLDLPVVMAVKLEDSRQRHPNDGSADLTAAMIRGLLRSDDRARFIVTHADRDCIEQVHYGSTPEEAERVLWDLCWLWGPPQDDLEHLVRTVGAARFCFGTGMPLRIPESSVAKLELLDLSPEMRHAIEGGNARRFQRQ